MRRHGRRFAPLAGQIGIRSVEGLDQRVHQAALLEAVHRAAIAAPPGGLGLVHGADGAHRMERLPGDLGVDLRKRARPAGRIAQFAGDGQHAVAQLLGFEAARREPREIGVLGIDPVQRVAIRIFAGALVSRRVQDHAMHGLHAPAMLDEERRQPVQQLRVRRLSAHLAEIIGVRRQAPAEMVLPDSIDHDAGRQRVAGIRDPPRQGRTPARQLVRDLRRGQAGVPCDRLQHAGPDPFRRSLDVTADQHMGRGLGVVPGLHVARSCGDGIPFPHEPVADRHGARLEAQLGEFVHRDPLAEQLEKLALFLVHVAPQRAVGSRGCGSRAFFLGEARAGRLVEVMQASLEFGQPRVQPGAARGEALPGFRGQERQGPPGERRLGEHCLHPVVVLGRNRVELVVVAPGATERETQE